MPLRHRQFCFAVLSLTCVDADAGSAQAKAVGQAAAGHGQCGGRGMVHAKLSVAGHQASVVGGSDAWKEREGG